MKLFSTIWVRLLFVIVFIIGVALRITFLNSVPVGISDDELDFVLTAQSIFYSGKTLDGRFSPFSMSQAPIEAKIPNARAPYMLIAPIAGFINNGLSGVKIPYAIISVFLLIIITAISWKLFGKRVALYTLFVSAFNPWSIFFGRTAFEAPLAVFFAYLFLFCLLFLNKWWILLACIPWLIGLYSYHGMIIIYPLILVIGLYGNWIIRKRVYTKQFLIVFVFGLICFMLFILNFNKDRVGTRINEIASPDNQIIISKVDDERRKAIQSKFNSVIVNKYTVTSWQIIGQYLGAFSVNHLFISGENRSTFSLWTHGLFYPIEMFLLIMGLYYAYTMWRKRAIWLMTLVCISPIPAAISLVGVSYALRASFMYPIFWIFIAIGIESLRIDLKSRKLVALGIILIYGVLILNFIHIYFLRNPVNNSEGFGFSGRILAKYIQLASNRRKNVLLIENNQINIFRQYIFYNKLINIKSIFNIQKSIRDNEFIIDNIKLIGCPHEIPNEVSDKIVINSAGKECDAFSQYKKNNDPIVIANMSDSGRIYEIYNDSICLNYDISDYQKNDNF